ncbi:MAG: potassium transporter [Muribaculaceae bacterium]|nr:potassium transporter [Muribaculaceae bacterium]
MNQSLRSLRNRFVQGYYRICNRFIGPLKRIRTTGMWISFVFSIVCLASLILYGGFYHSETNKQILLNVIRLCQVVFAVNILYNIIFLFKETVRGNKLLKWIMDIAVLMSVLPMLYPHPLNPWIPILERILYSHWFLFTVVGVYSVLEISFGILRLLGRRTNPSLLLAGSFLFFIFIGTLVLMLPRCSTNGISFVDALFISTSAVSITGLCPVDIAEVFTPFGILILSCLIQIGALGVLTFTSFFALFFSGNNSIYSQLMVRDMIYSKNADALLPTLLYVFLFTLSIEALGAIAIFFTLPGDFPIPTLEHRILFSCFQSMSAFCNAGFTWLENGMSNASLMESNQMIYIVVGMLVFLGGIGFPILVNFKTALGNYVKRVWARIMKRRRNDHRVIHIYDINTKIVLVTSLILTVTTIILFLLFEWNNTLSGMSFGKKLIQAFFNAFVPRSSGFSSVNPAGFLNITVLLMMILMWIGGASQSTAGGIKVNTFAAIFLNMRAVLKGRDRVTAYHRTISEGSIRRANAVVTLSIISFALYGLTLVALEPELSVRDVLFETASAIFTVGSSLGITSDLCNASKILLCTAMFIGRVGILSLLMGFFHSPGTNKLIYPYDNIIIN